MVLAGELEGFREQLVAALAEAERALADAAAGCTVVTLDQSSVGRLSRMEAMQQQAMSVGMKERLARQKSRLEAALNRIRTKQFAICCQCGDGIPPERLQADIAAPFCSYCQEEIDERRRTA
jgi:DnaK suppressor protein